jgi:hypothetical protein
MEKGDGGAIRFCCRSKGKKREGGGGGGGDFPAAFLPAQERKNGGRKVVKEREGKEEGEGGVRQESWRSFVAMAEAFCAEKDGNQGFT